MPPLAPEIELRTSPHFHSNRSVEMIMRNVVYALLPLCAFSVWNFGLSALALILVSVLSCLVTEHLFCWLSRRKSSLGDWSVTITGILLALTLPPGFPLWMVAVGGFVSVGLGKMAFGGLGFNVFNPALVGRAFLQACFPTAITAYSPALAKNRFTEFIPTTFTPPFLQPPPLADWIERVRVDAFSGATPLMQQKFDKVTADWQPLFFGTVSGSAGETPALLILLCGAYLAARNFMDWRIAFSMLASAFVSGAAFHFLNPAVYPHPWFVLLSGGLMLGAVFMATDMVASPVTPTGVWIYGALMGLITVVIRNLGGLPEGVMYAILLGNAVSPLIDNLTQPRVYGVHPRRRTA
ncbi:MAG: RnfABCDGE type electron transport complex subunit D [Bryobacteraceae bacterium]|nr:RnfABCDGE type electron transport complex subunit D [Bryobacteraceae bacterium]MDW8379505.1 RnfABCDGE type electron transport complex subunit D [Bryobacterales bacterium]